MLEGLQDRLARVTKTLRGEGHLTEYHIETALREIRLALLEAIRVEALGIRPELLGAVQDVRGQVDVGPVADVEILEFVVLARAARAWCWCCCPSSARWPWTRAPAR